MCYAIPGKVVEINAKTVTVDYFGETKQAYNELANLQIGDYVYAQGGFVVEKVPPAEAQDILDAWHEIFFDLKETDERLSPKPSTTKSEDKVLNRILERVKQGKEPRLAEANYLLNLTDPESLAYVYKTANFLRHKYLGNSCCVHGIIEISNYCRCACQYCGIACGNTQLKRYRMSKQEIYSAVEVAVNQYGFKALVLQSGEDTGYSVADLAEIVRTIKANHAVLIFISFGEIGLDGLAQLFEAGARGLLMRFETNNAALFRQLHPGCELNTRLEHLRHAAELGYLIITGGLVGLPGQTLEDLANDVFLAKELKTEMYSFGPFLAHPQTALANSQTVEPELMTKVLALVRLVDPVQAKVLVTTGFETLSPQAREQGLMSGANSVMINVTPQQYRKLYAIYPNRKHDDEEISSQIEQTLALLKSLGRAPTDLGAE